MQAVRHDLSRGLPTRKSKLSGHLWFCVFIKMNCMCLFSVYLLMLNKFCPSPSPSPGPITVELDWLFPARMVGT